MRRKSRNYCEACKRAIKRNQRWKWKGNKKESYIYCVRCHSHLCKTRGCLRKKLRCGGKKCSYRSNRCLEHSPSKHCPNCACESNKCEGLKFRQYPYCKSHLNDFFSDLDWPVPKDLCLYVKEFVV